MTQTVAGEQTTDWKSSVSVSPAASHLPVAPAPESTQQTRWLLPVLILTLGNFMAVLDITIVNVAVPAIQKGFGGSLDDVLWIATAYTLMLGVVVPVSGWLGDCFGLGRIYLLSLLGFAAGSALCGIAWNLDVLISFRVLQAISGGIMPVVAMTLLYRVVPPDKISSAMGVFGVGTVCGPAAGPVVGGYLVEYYNWRLVFYINVPIAIAGAVAAFFILPKVAPTAWRRFDIVGFVFIAFGLFSLLLAVSEGPQWGWASYPILILIAAGLNSLALFVVVELVVEEPLLDLRILKVRTFSFSLILLAIITVNLLAIAFYVPVFMQQGQSMQAFDSGLLLLPQAVLMGALMPMVGQVYNRIGPRWVSVVGLVICAYGTYLLTDITVDMTHAGVIFWTCVRAVGMGLSLMTIMTAGLSAVPPSQTSQASAMNNVVRQVAGALGLAMYSAMSTAQQTQTFADRAPLLASTGSSMDPRILAMQHNGPGGLIPLFQELTVQTQAEAYSDIFLVTAVLTAACVVLGLMLPVKAAGGEKPMIME